jgi:hypothetical protein
MKKLITKLLTAAMLLTALALPMTSCSEASKLNRMDEAERAVAFYQLIEEKADAATSVSVETKMNLKLDIGDVAYEQANEGVATYVETDGSFTYLEQATTTVWVGGEKTVTYTDEGYSDGMMFSYTKEGKVETKLKSPITAEEYEAFREHQVEDIPEVMVGEGYCTVMTCAEAEDGTWTATYEGFTEEGLKPFLYILRGIETAVNAEHTFKDVRLVCCADAELNPVSMCMEFIFDEKEGAETRVPQITTETYYKGYNNTVLNDAYDLSDFTEVSDLRMVENFLSALQDRETAESGAFTLTTKASAVYSGESNKTTNVQNVTYKNLNGYEFTVTGEEEGYEVTISYKNRVMATTVRDASTGSKVHSESVSMTDFEAQATVQQLMDSESISSLDIVDAKVTDEEKGIYTFTLGNSVKNELSEQYEASYGAPVKSFKGDIKATVVEGKLMAYTYHVYTTVELNGSVMTITVDMTVAFSDLVEDGESV